MRGVIKDSPRSEPRDYDVIEQMEKEWPEMTKEFKEIQRQQYELFLHKQHDMGQVIYRLGHNFKHQKRLNYHLQVCGFV